MTSPFIDVTLCAMVMTSVTITSGTYLQPWNSREISPKDKTNDIIVRENVAGSRHQGAVYFKDDREIRRYLKSHGRQLMIWRCRNAIQHVIDNEQKLPFIDLYCDVIGTVLNVEWHHRGKLIAGNTDRWHHQRNWKRGVQDSSVLSSSSEASPKNRCKLTIATHSETGIYYLAWLDFRLRIYNATRRDSGQYVFDVTGPDGQLDQHSVYVDIVSSHPLSANTYDRRHSAEESFDYVTRRDGSHVVRDPAFVDRRLTKDSSDDHEISKKQLRHHHKKWDKNAVRTVAEIWHQ